MSLKANRRAIAAELAAVLGEAIPVTIDPRNVNPPCVLVGAPDPLDPAPCGWAGEVTVWLLAPGPGNLDALDVLCDLLDDVRDVARLTIAGPARSGTYYTDPTGDTGLPGYSFPVLITT